MPTNYTGSSLAIQSPGTAPADVNAPLLVLPAAGDPDTAASVAQAFKILADYIAWERSPFSLASNPPITPIKAYLNGAGQQRFMIDKLGFPSGKLVQWNEDFGGAHPFDWSLVVGGGPTRLAIGGSRFMADVPTGGAGNLRAITADVAYGIGSNFVTSFLALEGVNGGGTWLYGGPTLSTRGPAIVVTPDVSVSYQWEAFIRGTDIGSVELAAGLSADPSPTGTGPLMSHTPSLTGVMFLKTFGGSAFWVTYEKADSTASVAVVTSYPTAAGVKYRMRIEIISANTSGDGSPHLNFFINDVLMSTSVSTAVVGKALYPFFRMTRAASGTSACDLWIGANQFRANLP